MSGTLMWEIISTSLMLFLVIMSFRVFSRARFHYRGLALQEIPKLVAPGSKGLDDMVLAAYREHRGNTIWWSGAYFGCMFGSALLSSSAAVILKIDSIVSVSTKEDAAAVLAAAAGLLITLNTTGDFHRKWLANREAATETENLAYDLLKSDITRDAVMEKLKEINTTRNEAIVRTAVETKR